MSKLVQFVTSLGEDVEGQVEYARDPEASMRKHGLSESDKAALRSGDEAVISRAIGDAPDYAFAKIVGAPTKRAA